MRMLSVLVMFGTMGCSTVDQSAVPLQRGNVDVYTAELQAYVGLGCGSLDCHGDSQRGLRIYAEYGLRSLAELRNQPVSRDEITENISSFAAISVGDDPDTSFVLLKALDTAAGGMGHKGGAVWKDREAAGFRCLQAWMNGAVDTAACSSARAEVALDE